MADDVEMKNTDKSDEPEWVRVTSHDGYSFMIKRKVANGSVTLGNMLKTGTFAEALSNTCLVNERGAVVEKLCEYMAFKATYENAGPKEEVPVNEFMERLPPEVTLELLLAADYLEV
ncbi:hypothetical protein PLICRDRAFT_44738 [Plicaturopsis crispa FD-325 SS-3]|nr:hypothetical protein PLICRDRAFT_44738 [Plicaturopsis crispa FD-325 SS-3]